MAITAVTFDFWNTIVREQTDVSRPRRLDGWLAVLEGEGIAVEREELGAAFASVWREFEERWRANVVYDAVEAVDHVLGRLDLTPPDDIRSALAEVLTDPPPEHDPALTDNIAACIDALRAAGVRIGIVCDVGLTPSRTLRRFLDGHGMLHRFDHWSFSDEVGVFKPSPVIFEHAMAGLGVADPAQVAHVGDLRRTDVAGAVAMGMTAVRYRGVFDDRGHADDGPVEAHHVLDDHADLPAVLGIA